MPNETILIIDDDPRIQKLLTQFLNEHGYNSVALGDGKKMEAWLENNTADLIILDLMLPGDDGLTLTRKIRESQQIPIVMLTARGEELDRIIGLEIGADDYLAKPFNPRELLARVRAVLRRSHTDWPLCQNNDKFHYDFGEFTLQSEQRILICIGKEIDLTCGEMDLLIILTNHPNQILSRDLILDQISGSDCDKFDRSIDVRINRLRQKIEKTPDKPRFIRTVWGKGYLFTPDPISEI